MQLCRQRFTPLVLALFFVCFNTGTASAEQIVVEAEDYVDFYDFAYDMIGTLPIGTVEVLQGLDMSGEWTEYTLPVSAYGSYSFSMICWGDQYVPFSFNIYFTPESGGDTQAITVSFTGEGCFL
jgi:hypothetical protein